MTVYHATALARLAPFLLYGDTEGLDPREMDAANRLLAEFDDLRGPYTVDVARDEDGHAVEPQHGRCEYSGIRGDVYDYTVTEMEPPATAKPDPATAPIIVDFDTRQIGMALADDDSIVHLDLRAGTVIEPRRLDPRLAEALRDCAAPENRDPAEAIAYVRGAFRIEGDAAAIRRTVAQWFADTPDQDLDDEDLNLDRIIWLVGGCVRDRRPFAVE